jgi:hypothetical protein
MLIFAGSTDEGFIAFRAFMCPTEFRKKLVRDFMTIESFLLAKAFSAF